MLNQCQFIGRLGRDPEVRFMQSGDKVVNLSLGVGEKWKDKTTGEMKEKTEWVRVVVFDQSIADVAEKYLVKGSLCFISGQLQTRKWTDQSGVEKYSTEIVLQRFRGVLTMLGGKSEGSQPSDGGESYTSGRRTPAASNADFDDSDIPF